jgi:photosystem II stability/assembly factor-like uncharacterized protein
MNSEERIEAVLRRRPADEREYQEPLRALAAAATLSATQPVKPLRRESAGTSAPRALAAVLAVVMIAAATLLFGLYGPPQLGRPATVPAVTGTDRPGASLSPEQIARAGIWRVGTIRSGGFWAIKGDALLTSTDGGQTWRGHAIPMAPDNTFVGDTVFVLDAGHAWTLTAARTIYRTVDGGATWTPATLPGECPMFIGLSFVDVRVGYLACLVDATPPVGASPTAVTGSPTATVMRSEDGGATWTVVASGVSTKSGPIGTNIVATDERTLWAATNDWDSGTQALLAVSRDGGATWSDAALQGINPVDKHPSGPYASLPVFPTAASGFIWASDSSGARMFRTQDGGLTWTEEPQPSDQARPPAVLLAPDSWITYQASPLRILHSSDGGAHWTSVEAGGVPDPPDVFFFGFSDEQHGVANMGQVLFVTADGGRTWTAPDLTAAAPAPSPGVGGDEATVRAMVNTYEKARLAGDRAAQDALLSPDCQLPDYQTDATPPPTPTAFQIVGVVRTGLTIDQAFGSISIDADYPRIYEVTVRETLGGGSTTDTKLLVAPLLGSRWRIWTAQPAVPEK